MRWRSICRCRWEISSSERLNIHLSHPSPVPCDLRSLGNHGSGTTLARIHKSERYCPPLLLSPFRGRFIWLCLYLKGVQWAFSWAMNAHSMLWEVKMNKKKKAQKTICFGLSSLCAFTQCPSLLWLWNRWQCESRSLLTTVVNPATEPHFHVSVKLFLTSPQPRFFNAI